MKTINEEEEKELSLQFEQLFNLTAKSIDFKVALKKLLNKWKGLAFLYSENAKLKHKNKTGITTDNYEMTRLFLIKEKEFAVDDKDFEKAAELRDVINNRREINRMKYFRLSYQIKYDKEAISIIYNSNSLLFIKRILNTRF